jgi:hypothetical protein
MKTSVSTTRLSFVWFYIFWLNSIPLSRSVRRNRCPIAFLLLVFLKNSYNKQRVIPTTPLRPVFKRLYPNVLARFAAVSIFK